MISYVSFMLTEQCNSCCKYCYVDAQSKSKKQTLEVNQILAFLKSFAEHNGKVVHFTGGEVLLYPELEQVLEYAKSLKLIVQIFTNGLLLDQDKFSRINGFIDSYAISLDGPEEVHDTNRGVKGAYQKVINALEIFKENKVHYSVQMTIGKSNLSYIDYVANIAYQYDAGSVKLANIIKAGRGIACPEECLSTEELLTLKLKACELSEKYKYRPIFQTNLYTKEEIGIYFKSDSLLPYYWIDSSGDICLFTTNNKDVFKIGHISEYPLQNIDFIQAKSDKIVKELMTNIRDRKICGLHEEIEMLAEEI